jgi:hypothetical protein
MPDPLDGTEEELEYWAERHGISYEEIEKAFDPKFKVKINRLASIDISNSNEIRLAVDQLYQPYGGLDQIGNIVYHYCKNNECNNPLQEEHNQSQRPENRIEDAYLRGWMLQNLCEKQQVSSPETLFFKRIKYIFGKKIKLGDEWNYEGKWVETLMKQYPEALLVAKWDYLDQMIKRGEGIHEWIEDGMPHADYDEIRDIEWKLNKDY